MRDAVSAAPPLQGARVQSIDLLRGLDVVLMLLVNDLAGVAGTPAFLRHVPGNVDGMTITDVVFPAFLFITGMAIPLAIDGRLRRGDAPVAIWRHVLLRALSLIAIGVFMVNAEYGKPGGLLPPHIWNILMTLAVVWIWRVPTSTSARAATTRATSPTIAWVGGALLLIALAIVYHSGDGRGGLLDFRARWWGILGLIGWAYLPAATVYLWSCSLWSSTAPERRDGLARTRSVVLLLGVVAILYALRIADRMDYLLWLGAARPYLSVALGTQTAVVLSGTALTVLLLRHREAQRPLTAFAMPALAYALGLAVAGALLHSLHDLHPAFWFSKIQGTAAWGLVSSAITAAVWTLLFVIVDLRGWRRWPTLVSIAGEQALMVYLIAPFLLSLFALSGALLGVDWYAALGRQTAAGFLRAIVFAWFTIRLCGWMRNWGLRLQL